jgi:predicted aldo/keto reductase-like oxidoreductase
MLFSQFNSANASPEVVTGIPRRALGDTGVTVSIVCLGGYHIGVPADEQASTKIIRAAIDSGINFMDNCSSYHSGSSELRMGKALQGGYRERVVLMTKIDSRQRASAAAEIDQCLKRLQTDFIDLMLLHDLKSPDPEKIFDDQGAIHALLQARQAGKIRFIGFSGHKSPAVHLHMLDVAQSNNVKFDAVLMPINLMDAHFESFETQVLPRLRREGIAALGMKPMCGGKLLEENLVTPSECLHYSFSQPVASILTGCDSIEILNQAIALAQGFSQLSETELSALRSKTLVAAAGGKIEYYKTVWP